MEKFKIKLEVDVDVEMSAVGAIIRSPTVTLTSTNAAMQETLDGYAEREQNRIMFTILTTTTAQIIQYMHNRKEIDKELNFRAAVSMIRFAIDNMHKDGVKMDDTLGKN